MDKTTRDLLTSIISGAIGDLCAHWGLTSAPLATASEALETVAVIGFTGDAVRGSLGMGVERAFLRQVLDGASDKMAEDWLGEAANQLLGRTKNRLYAHGVAVAVAVPTVLRGLRIQVSQGTEGDVLTFAVATPAGALTVWFDVQHEATFTLQPEASDAAPCALEGEMVLF